MKIKNIIFFIMIVSLAGMQSCFDPYYDNSYCVRGAGPIVSEVISVADFNAVVSQTVVDVEIVQGDVQEVIVEGNENMIDELSLLVFRGTLEIDLRGKCYKDFRLKVYITVPEIEALTVESTGDISIDAFENLKSLYINIESTGDITSDGPLEIEGLLEIESESTGRTDLDVSCDEVKAYLSGTGNVTLVGSCNSQYIETDGTAKYNAFEFDSEVCRVYSDGVGDVRVYVTDRLDVTINSVGSVYYMGDPKIYLNDNSIGDLIQVN